MSSTDWHTPDDDKLGGTFLAFVILALIALIALFILMLGNKIDTWNDRASKMCQEQYGVNTHHSPDTDYCITQNGDIKGLKW